MAAAIEVYAQASSRVPVIGLIRGSSFNPDDPSRPLLLQAFREVGYEDGRTVKINQRYAAGRVEVLPQIAATLVDEKVDVILTANEPALRAAKQATTSIPIVFMAWDYDALASGLIDSLNRPGGNVTGVSMLQPQLLEKRLELLKEAVPGTRRVLAFWDAFSRKQLEALAPAARALGLELRPVQIRDISGLGNVLRATKRSGDAGIFLFSPAVYANRAQVAAEALKVSLPAIFPEEWYVPPGGLLSYGPDIGEVMQRVAYMVDRILKGSSPGALPVEQVSKFRMAVNLKTAKAIGVRIPESVLLRADEVIR
jgi:putative ABC transport system substrate-binding protein